MFNAGHEFPQENSEELISEPLASCTLGCARSVAALLLLLLPKHPKTQLRGPLRAQRGLK